MCRVLYEKQRVRKQQKKTEFFKQKLMGEICGIKKEEGKISFFVINDFKKSESTKLDNILALKYTVRLHYKLRKSSQEPSPPPQ